MVTSTIPSGLGLVKNVGAGLTGLSTALHLARRGYRPLVIEAEHVAYGASGRNGGQLINGISGLSRIRKKHGDGIARMLWDLRWRGNDIIYDRTRFVLHLNGMKWIGTPAGEYAHWPAL